jgi:hypothetical protein
MLSQNQEARISNINYACAGLSVLGGVAGVIYSNSTGGGFWRGVGYYLLGSFAVGVGTRVIALPFENKILKEAQ